MEKEVKNRVKIYFNVSGEFLSITMLRPKKLETYQYSGKKHTWEQHVSNSICVKGWHLHEEKSKMEYLGCPEQGWEWETDLLLQEKARSRSCSILSHVRKCLCYYKQEGKSLKHFKLRPFMIFIYSVCSY